MANDVIPQNPFIQRAIDMRRAGSTINQIAQALYCSKDDVFAWLQAACFDPRAPAEDVARIHTLDRLDQIDDFLTGQMHDQHPVYNKEGELVGQEADKGIAAAGLLIRLEAQRSKYMGTDKGTVGAPPPPPPPMPAERTAELLVEAFKNSGFVPRVGVNEVVDVVPVVKDE